MGNKPIHLKSKIVTNCLFMIRDIFDLLKFMLNLPVSFRINRYYNTKKVPGYSLIFVFG